MDIQIEVCDTLDQLVQRRTTLSSASYKGKVLYQSVGEKTETGIILRILNKTTANGGNSQSSGAQFDEYKNKYILVVSIPG